MGSSYADSMVDDPKTPMYNFRDAIYEASDLDARIDISDSFKNRRKLISIVSDGAKGYYSCIKQLSHEKTPFSIPGPVSGWKNWSRIESSFDFGNQYFEYDKYIKRYKLLAKMLKKLLPH